MDMIALFSLFAIPAAILLLLLQTIHTAVLDRLHWNDTIDHPYWCKHDRMTFPTAYVTHIDQQHLTEPHTSAHWTARIYLPSIGSKWPPEYWAYWDPIYLAKEEDDNDDMLYWCRRESHSGSACAVRSQQLALRRKKQRHQELEQWWTTERRQRFVDCLDWIPWLRPYVEKDGNVRQLVADGKLAKYILYLKQCSPQMAQQSLAEELAKMQVGYGAPRDGRPFFDPCPLPDSLIQLLSETAPANSTQNSVRG